jgi:hypothetical protein
MSLKQIVSRRKVTASVAGGVAAIALSNPAAVIAFQRGQAGATKVVGQVPASFAAGAGTIVTGTAADKAKAAAQAAYPGGTINRVVLLSDGQYNVHVIGVNWPHHVFVSKDFKVIGAE